MSNNPTETRSTLLDRLERFYARHLSPRLWLTREGRVASEFLASGEPRDDGSKSQHASRPARGGYAPSGSWGTHALQSRERDRGLLASDIHDGLVQHITGAQMHLQAILEADNTLTEHVRRELQVSLDLIQKAIREARHLIRGLRPPVLDELGIVDAVQYMIDESPPGGPVVEFRPEGQFEHLDPLLESSIFRIIQEALTNARRHSRSDRIVVRMMRTDDMIQSEIRDSGVGFDTTRVAADSYGLQGMRERARLLGGRTIIKSNPGKGTQVFVELPIARASGRKAKVNNGS